MLGTAAQDHQWTVSPALAFPRSLLFCCPLGRDCSIHDIQGWMLLCCGSGPVHHRRVSRTLGFTVQLQATPSSCDKCISRLYQMPPYCTIPSSEELKHHGNVLYTFTFPLVSGHGFQTASCLILIPCNTLNRDLPTRDLVLFCSWDQEESIAHSLGDAQ